MLVTKGEYNGMHDSLITTLWDAACEQQDPLGDQYALRIPGLMAVISEMAHELLAKAGYTCTPYEDGEGRYTPGYSHEEGNPRD